MALKVYKDLVGWDSLDKFYNRTIEGVYFISEDGFIRTFCRCGKVYGEEKSGCSCGRNNFESITIDRYSSRSSQFYNVYSKTEDKIFELTLKSLDFDKSDREYAKFTLSEKIILTINNKRLEFIDKSSQTFIKEEIMRDYYDFEELKKQLFFVGTRYHEFGFELFKTFQFKQYYPILQEDPAIWQYKSLARKLISNLPLDKCYAVSNINFKKLLENNKLYDEEHYDILDYYAETLDNWRANFSIIEGEKESYYGKEKETVSSFLNKYDRKFLSDKSSTWYALRHYVKTKMIRLDNAARIMYQIEDLLNKVSELSYENWSYQFKGDSTVLSKFNNDWIKLFNSYLKDRVELADKPEIFEDFIKDTVLLSVEGVDVNEENLKQKNFNYMLNTLNLKKDLDISQDKVDLFFDAFDISPITAIELLKDRRSLTKKQKEDFLDLLSKI